MGPLLPGQTVIAFNVVCPGVYILQNTMGGEGVQEWPTAKINGSRDKNEEKGGKGKKVRQKREETPKNFPPSA